MELTGGVDLSTEASTNMASRQERIKRLRLTILEKGLEEPKKVLIARFCINNKISKSAVYGYLELLLDGLYVFEHAYKGDYWLSLHEDSTDFRAAFDEAQEKRMKEEKDK